MSKKINYFVLNKKILKPGKLYRHTKKYNDWYFKRNTYETKYLFFHSGDIFHTVDLDKEAILMFIKFDCMPNFSGQNGINCTFLYGKLLIESYYDCAEQIIIFEEA